MSIYARKFNKRHGRDGPLFKSRYHACLITEESYLLAVTRYVHRNPVDFGVEDLAAYRWSSLGIYLGRRRKQRWMTLDFTLRVVGGRAAYANFVLGPFETFVEHHLASMKPPILLGPAPTREASKDPIGPHRAA